MKNAKGICRNIIIFVVTMAGIMSPTLLFGAEEEMNAVFGQPEYWMISLLISLLITMDVENNSDE